MNPVGYRMEEKKESDYNTRHQLETKSTHSYKSTQSSRSSVLERARAYNKRIDEQNKTRRSKSLERSEAGSQASRSDYSGRSRSAGRASQNTWGNGGNQVPSRERALASVRKDTAKQQQPTTPSTLRQRMAIKAHPPVENTPQQQQQPHPSTPASTAVYSHNSRNTANNNTPRSQKTTSTQNSKNRVRQPQPQPSRKMPQQQQQAEVPQEGGNPIVTPELLVDALSGHEDGLLAIAEKLMEHYDSGYDVMGEAIIDAFADVQKLFQHVVEAAHMEGAAFEASRREAELAEMKKNDPAALLAEEENAANPVSSPQSAGAPGRHDEFVDQDVKDTLTEAIKKGSAMRDAGQHEECFVMYEQACQSASALLPVDSDHRGRLQLSLARAESMAPDRACAILRYAMDDVLRSGMRAGRTPLPDPSKRADVVLTRPSTATKVAQSPDEALASLTEELKEIMNAPVYNDTPLQSVATRFWDALVESQKSQQKHSEKLEQSLGKLKGDYLLAKAEWEEKLNQSNAKVEQFKEKYDRLKEQYHNSEARRRHGGEDYMEQARANYASKNSGGSGSFHEQFNSLRSQTSGVRAGSVASMGSGIALHAKKLVNSLNDFNCNSTAAGSAVNDSHEELRRSSSNRKSPKKPTFGGAPNTPARSTASHLSSATPSSNRLRSKSSSRSFQEYSKSPKRMDV